jgi:hypothetical protein
LKRNIYFALDYIKNPILGSEQINIWPAANPQGIAGNPQGIAGNPKDRIMQIRPGN